MYWQKRRFCWKKNVCCVLKLILFQFSSLVYGLIDQPMFRVCVCSHQWASSKKKTKNDTSLISMHNPNSQSRVLHTQHNKTRKGLFYVNKMLQCASITATNTGSLMFRTEMGNLICFDRLLVWRVRSFLDCLLLLIQN